MAQIAKSFDLFDEFVLKAAQNLQIFQKSMISILISEVYKKFTYAKKQKSTASAPMWAWVAQIT